MDRKKLDELLRRQYFYEIVNLAPYASKDWVTGKYSEIFDTFDTKFFDKSPNLMMSTHGLSGMPSLKIEDHKHPYFEMMYVYDGSVTHYIGPKTIAMSKGDFLLIAPETTHSIEECNPGDIAVNIIISPEFLSPDFMQMLSSNNLFSKFLLRTDETIKYSDPGFIYFSPEDEDTVSDTAINIMCEFFDPDISSASTIKCLLVVLFNDLFRVWKDSGGKTEIRHEIDNNDIWQIVQYIESNYTSATLNEAASRFGYDPFYLSKLIKKELGSTFTEIKQRICMEYAKSMLTLTDKPIQDIATQVGYSNMSYFYKLFDKYCSMTPAEYRKNYLSQI